MRILGLDPGLATTGYAIVRFGEDNLDQADHSPYPSSSRPELSPSPFPFPFLLDFGIYETTKNTPLPERLATIQRDLSELIEKQKPEIVIIEKLFFAKNTKTALDVAQARGVLIATLQYHGIEIREITPNEVKLGLTGDGKADKQQIQKMLMLTLGLSGEPKPDDAADAIAIALSWNQR